MAERTSKNENAGTARIIKPAIISVGIGTLTSVIILLIMSFIMSMTHVPQLAMEPMTIFALCAGAFTSGFICTKAMGERGLIHGAVTGLIMAVILLISRIIMGFDFFEIPLIFRLVFILLSSMIGGTVAVNTRIRRR